MFTLKSAGPYKVTWKMCVKPSDKNQNRYIVFQVFLFLNHIRYAIEKKFRQSSNTYKLSNFKQK